MTFQQFATSGFGTRLWMMLARWLPPRAGHALANVITGVLYRRRNAPLYRILYANQAVVRGVGASPKEIDLGVKAVLKHAGMVTLDLMQMGARGEDVVQRSVTFPPEIWDYAATAKADGRGLLICGCHLSNFNLALLAFALKGFPVQVLSTAVTRGGFQLVSQMRARGMLEETPLDAGALRKALVRLRDGGAVATGIDWPYGADKDDPMDFFGRPSLLPTGYLRIALSANALLLPMACRWSPERGYHVIAAPPIEPQHIGDRSADMHHNARRVLAVIERWVSETPEQWLMYHPVWPAAAA